MTQEIKEAIELLKTRCVGYSYTGCSSQILHFEKKVIDQIITKLREASEQPLASEFTKECRALRKKGATSEQLEYATKLMEACDHLDRAEAENKRLKEAFGLARSIILSGEKMTPQADEIFEQALKG